MEKWKERILRTIPCHAEYGTARFYQLGDLGKEVNAVMGFNNTRITLTGNFVVDLSLFQTGYPDEIEFVLWSTKPPKIDKRAPNKGDYSRLNISIEANLARNFLLDIASKLKPRLEEFV